jgi:Flp pilus assembly protein CpaB
MVEIAQNLFASRRRSLIAGGVAAGLAVIVLVVYLHNYRNSVNSAVATGPVLVAKQLIPKGTSGDTIAATSQYQVAQLPKSEFKNGAITDPGILTGRVALTDIYPRQQLTAAEFSLPGVDTLGQHITGQERAISVSLDAVHGLAGQIANGDHVDIYVGLPAPNNGGTAIKLLIADMTVLRAPYSPSGGIFTLKATTKQAADLAWAQDNARLWFVLRPPSGAKTVVPGWITERTLLLGLNPVH